mmetsp:Transcript_34126/g.85622  ORF Transcript_34126/g.85622 Transcript_34126/m.85622 type:complete len:331 (+) Transcript_34126:1191-2183(+)
MDDHRRRRERRRDAAPGRVAGLRRPTDGQEGRGEDGEPSRRGADQGQGRCRLELSAGRALLLFAAQAGEARGDHRLPHAADRVPQADDHVHRLRLGRHLLPVDVRHQQHAQLVGAAREWCRSQPDVRLGAGAPAFSYLVRRASAPFSLVLGRAHTVSPAQDKHRASANETSIAPLSGLRAPAACNRHRPPIRSSATARGAVLPRALSSSTRSCSEPSRSSGGMPFRSITAPRGRALHRSWSRSFGTSSAAAPQSKPSSATCRRSRRACPRWWPTCARMPCTSARLASRRSAQTSARTRVPWPCWGSTRSRIMLRSGRSPASGRRGSLEDE